jgi:hypothetical protein
LIFIIQLKEEHDQDFHGPTLDVASVKLPNCIHALDRDIDKEGGAEAHLLSVVDLPDEGLPTRPMSGSRGIAVSLYVGGKE